MAGGGGRWRSGGGGASAVVTKATDHSKTTTSSAISPLRRSSGVCSARFTAGTAPLRGFPPPSASPSAAGGAVFGMGAGVTSSGISYAWSPKSAADQFVTSIFSHSIHFRVRPPLGPCSPAPRLYFEWFGHGTTFCAT